MKKFIHGNNNKQFTFIDLFAGIGGFHLAFHKVGAKCVFASEWDKYARKTYEYNFAHISPELFTDNRFGGDITQINAPAIPDFDILSAGFPCQAFSIAGLQKGFQDSRGTMFFEIVRIIKQKKPAAFFLENVKHFLRHDDGKTFAHVKKIIEEDLGYSFHWKIVRACDFGLPQLRPRLFMVGFKNKETPFVFPEPVPLTMTLSDIFKGHCTRKIGYTICVGGRGKKPEDKRNWSAYYVDGKILQLTSKEGKQLMGFPDWFEFPVSETQGMKQLGNSVAVNAVEAVAKEIIKVLSLVKK